MGCNGLGCLLLCIEDAEVLIDIAIIGCRQCSLKLAISSTYTHAFVSYIVMLSFAIMGQLLPSSPECLASSAEANRNETELLGTRSYGAVSAA
jgi:hypothetical protein